MMAVTQGVSNNAGRSLSRAGPGGPEPDSDLPARRAVRLSLRAAARPLSEPGEFYGTASQRALSRRACRVLVTQWYVTGTARLAGPARRITGAPHLKVQVAVALARTTRIRGPAQASVSGSSPRAGLREQQE